MKNTLSLSITTLLFLILIATPVFAQETKTTEAKATTATQLDVDPGAVKGDVLYVVDRAAEEVQKIFITNAQAKTEFSERLYKERLAEAQVLLEEGKEEEMQKTLELYIHEFATVVNAITDTRIEMTDDDKALYQMKLGEDATRSLALLGDMKTSATDTAYFISLVEAKTIDQQLQLVSAINVYDTSTAERILEESLEIQVRGIQEKADEVADTGKMSELDSSIQNLNIYVSYAKNADASSSSNASRIVENSINGVVDILSDVQMNTNTYTETVLNDGRSNDATSETTNTNSNVNTNNANGGTRNTAASGGFGAPAYQSNSGGISWQQYILSR